MTFLLFQNSLGVLTKKESIHWGIWFSLFVRVMIIEIRFTPFALVCVLLSTNMDNDIECSLGFKLSNL